MPKTHEMEIHAVVQCAAEQHALSERVSRQRIARAKAAFNTRRVDLSKCKGLVAGEVRPSAGDLVLARVDRLGQHPRIELADGRRSRLFVGDEIIVCFGARYAPDQFTVEVPDDLGPCALAASGGLAGRVVSHHASMRRATAIVPLGLLADGNGNVLNVRDAALPHRADEPARRPQVIAVIGSSMNAGKTTTAAYLIRGLVAGGLRVAATKVTGTGSGADVWFMADAGASPVLDFTDAGLVSTCGIAPAEVRRVFRSLMAHATDSGADVVIVEVADGLYQRETSQLLRSDLFRQWVDAVIFAAPDAMSAVAGVAMVTAMDLPLLGISGAISASPLASSEAQQASGVAVLTIDMLCNPDFCTPLVFSAHPRLTKALANGR
ncbi:MAG: hypothetical protein Q8L45_10585 [Xanthomonadaceae bacterium]|nr:hypothetical protein [Xanthomonadaceae bacterium]MDP2187017.1 hypothetical protein [Xanthomonadales bacterium]MDZ4117441.1 hypothetical protein [Xanthomonadaceae bacterium]MDZ4379647.1 hypothetical protein [Xanthomonadaceae bacterium]